MRDDARAQLLDTIGAHLVGRLSDHPLRVAVDGITGCGKSTFAAELVAAVGGAGTASIHLSTDDFHHQRAHRHRDPDPARGYYRDAYDLDSFRTFVLDPLGRGGDRCYRPRRHDLDTDHVLDEPPVLAPITAIVVVDGSFLQSSALTNAWDEVVYLETSFPRAAERAAQRDAKLFGSEVAARAAYATRYHAACRLYLNDVAPQRMATVVVDNNDIARPRLLRLGRP